MPLPTDSWRPLALMLLGLSLVLPRGAGAAAFTPGNDAQVLETVPARKSDPAARELQALREAARSRPQDLDAALALAARLFEAVTASGDPRYVGQIQAALLPWWSLPAPPPAVRVQRAMVLQFDHRFAEAMADLDAALAAEPGHAGAWSWRLAIQLVQADYAGAAASCERLAALAPPLVGSACRAQLQAATGQADAAARGLRAALAQPDAEPEQRLWSLTRLAEIEERRGQPAAAEAAYRAAMAQGQADVYLLAAYADFLLDQGRPAEVMALLQGQGRADVLLLRLALAAHVLGDSRARGHADELAARFDAARLRGDTSHRKEEARFVLAVRGDSARALTLARQNWAEQRELADARLLLQAALAARDAEAARPVLQWMAASGVQSPILHALAAQLKALR